MGGYRQSWALHETGLNRQSGPPISALRLADEEILDQ
jgi:hypothetical protein